MSSRTKLRRGDRRAIWAACILPFTIPLAALLSTQARADGPTVEAYAFANATAVCALLDQDPNIMGVQNVVTRLAVAGFTPTDINSVLVLSVANVCPRHQVWLTALAAQFPPTKPSDGISASVGGVLR